MNHTADGNRENQPAASAGRDAPGRRIRLRLPAALALLGLLGACAGRPPAPTPATYDLGPMPTVARQALPAISLAEISAPAWLDSSHMVYRLTYADPRQAHFYADSRWSMAPAQLLEQRLKMRIAAAGGVVVGAGSGAAGLPLLRIELDDFGQDFEAPAASSAQLRARATLFSGRRPLAQQSFARQLPAAGADAAGGARALATATDLLLDDLLQWLGTVAPRK